MERKRESKERAIEGRGGRRKERRLRMFNRDRGEKKEKSQTKHIEKLREGREKERRCERRSRPSTGGQEREDRDFNLIRFFQSSKFDRPNLKCRVCMSSDTNRDLWEL